MARFEITRCVGRPLAVGVLCGDVPPTDLLAEIDRGYREGDVEPGMARLVILCGRPGPERFRPHELDAIRGLVQRWERRAPQPDRFVAVHLALSDHMAVLAEIYMTIWQGLGTGEPQFSLVRTCAQANAALAGLCGADFDSRAFRPDC